MVDALTAWQAQVLRTYGHAAGMDASVLVRPSSFHITLGMLALPTAEDVAAAATLLRSVSAAVYDVLQTRTLLATVRGLRAMEPAGRPAPARAQQLADVLYFGVADADPAGNRFQAMIGAPAGWACAACGATTQSCARSLTVPALLTHNRRTAGPLAMDGSARRGADAVPGCWAHRGRQPAATSASLGPLACRPPPLFPSARADRRANGLLHGRRERGSEAPAACACG